MKDPIDDMVRKASAPEIGPRRKPRPKGRLALALLMATAALLILVPLILALTGDPTGSLLGLATGEPNLFNGGNR